MDFTSRLFAVTGHNLERFAWRFSPTLPRRAIWRMPDLWTRRLCFGEGIARSVLERNESRRSGLFVNGIIEDGIVKTTDCVVC